MFVDKNGIHNTHGKKRKKENLQKNRFIYYRNMFVRVFSGFISTTYYYYVLRRKFYFLSSLFFTLSVIYSTFYHSWLRTSVVFKIIDHLPIFFAILRTNVPCALGKKETYPVVYTFYLFKVSFETDQKSWTWELLNVLWSKHDQNSAKSVIVFFFKNGMATCPHLLQMAQMHCPRCCNYMPA